MPRYNGEAIKKGCGGGAWSHIHVLMIFLCWKHIKVYVKYGLLYNNCKVFHFIETHTNSKLSIKCVFLSMYQIVGIYIHHAKRILKWPIT